MVGTQLIDQNSSISHHLGNEDAHGTMEAPQRAYSIIYNITKCLLYTRPGNIKIKKIQSAPSRSSETSKVVGQANRSFQYDVVEVVILTAQFHR